MKRTLLLSLYFRSAEKLRRWAMTGWADLAEPLRVQWFGGTGERPVRRPDHSASDLGALREYMSQERPGYTLFGERLWYDMSLSDKRRQWTDDGMNRWVDMDCTMDIWAEAEPELVQALPGLVLSLQVHGLNYGYGGALAELQRRNQYQIAVFEKPGKFITGHLGRDHTRYVPGLYWLNYFSEAYLEQHRLDVKGIADRLNVTLKHTAHGILLQLYPRPQEWIDLDTTVSQVIRETPGVFSIDDVPIPQSIALRDQSWGAEAWRRWP
jgi:hypothetical protein